MLMQAAGLTPSQVNKAGRILRSLTRGAPPAFEEWSWAITVVVEYRAAHQYPLTKATMGLRSMVNTERCRVEVSQRLKRIPTIIDKLKREPTMKLATMQDIGGCRAVLDSIDEVRRVQHRLAKRRPPLRVRDYIQVRRDTGYRGVHVVVCYSGVGGSARAIEVQLRTRAMHEWAVTVERLSGRLKKDLKGGAGPPQILELLEAISEAMALEELGQAVPAGLEMRIDQLRQAALPYLRVPQ